METNHNPVLENLRYKSASGALDFSGIRYLLIRPETLVEIQKVIEEKFGSEAAHEIFYQSGFRGTSLTAGKLLDSGLTPRECLEAMFRMGAHLGWGKFELPNMETVGKENIEVTIHGSPFARAYGAAEQPVCAILSGALAGIFSSLLGAVYICNEVGCAVSGDASCTFRLVKRPSND